MTARYLSKSKVLAGWQCRKRLWLEVHAPEHARYSAATERALGIGHEVGELARRLFPGGTLIGHDGELGAALAQTAAQVARPGPLTLYEATFRHEGVLIRADVLVRDAAGRVRLVEVKASTGVKPVNHIDCAVQAWVLAGLGLAPERIELGHIDNRFVYPGGDDYEGLLVFVDLTDKVLTLLDEVPRWLAEDRAVLAGEMPGIRIGPQCRNPYECAFLPYCTPPQPHYPVSRLPGGGKAVWRLLEEGIDDIRDVPPGYLGNERQEWVRRVTVAGQAELRPAAGEALRALPWPRYYFDFETVAFPVPVWAGTRPYQPLPFQWSCHVESAPGVLEHREFLADGGEAPMRRCAETLLEALGDEGPVMVYTNYEAGVLKTLAGMYPDLAPRLEAVAARLFDLHPLVRANYYHPDMLGSWSIKAVLPTLAPDLSYAALGEVQEGNAASDAFQEIMAPETPAGRRASLRRDLSRYCALDTLAMVRLAGALAAGSAVAG
ncbi:MAG TPA: DUF2779 domain-containing protein [Gammaproteobacteria bacterium]|nr:DUF2779 domain-containing protein [Gammaproteobacteria bacterium]